MRPLAVAIFSLGLAGCQTTNPATVTNGECRIYPKAEYAYKGKARQDQVFIDKVIEGGVGACKFERPKARPVAWDGQVHKVAGKTVPVPIPPETKKEPFWKRFRGHRP